MKHLLAPLLIALTLNGTAPIPKDDVVFRALNDELVRSKEKLHLDQYDGPYFLSYTVHQTDRLAVMASFGCVDSCHRERKRSLSVDVREGDYALDSSNTSNFFARLMGGSGGEGEPITADDDYDAIRHSLWLRTDSAYKKAIEELAAKKAFLQENDVKERPDSMSKEKPVVDIEPVAHLDCDLQKSQELVRKLSAIFREFPGVKKSLVGLDESATTRWFLNNEGFCNRTPHNFCTVIAVASAQVADGSVISDAEVIAGEKESDLPAYTDMEKRVRALADRITSLAAAPAIEQEEYRGPILFEKDAAAEFFSEVLQPNVGHAPEGLNKANQLLGKMTSPLAEKLGTRILPPFITVVDDPSSKNFGKTKIVSSYAIDDDGLRAQKITLVDKGILKTFAMSRAPSHEIKQSNGHARGRAGIASNLYIESDKKMKPSELKAALIAMGKEDGLKEVLLARRISNYSTALLEPSSVMSTVASIFRSGETKLLPPVLLYRVSVADGHEELARGAEFGNMTMRVLRDIEATGDDSQPYPVLSLNTVSAQGVEANTIVTPSILIREVELQKPAHQNELPPTLKNPYFDKQ
jgi:predicted Zn-dependent protease